MQTTIFSIVRNEAWDDEVWAAMRQPYLWESPETAQRSLKNIRRFGFHVDEYEIPGGIVFAISEEKGYVQTLILLEDK